MLAATLDTGQTLLALNEVFVGHATHQSARYQIDYAGQSEAQSSSGLIISSGTGATGWALSIARATGATLALGPTDPAAVFLVREPWPSQATGTRITTGRLSATQPLAITSRMNEHGVVFADGMEQDRLPFPFGAALDIQIATRRLRLVPGENKLPPPRRVAKPPPLPPRRS